MSYLLTNTPWDKLDVPRVIISDGGYGIASGAMAECVFRHIPTGGYTATVGEDQRQLYGLIKVDKYQAATRLNIMNSDAVIVLSRDPRLPTITNLIQEAKCRHRPVRLLLTPNATGLKAWLGPRKVIFLSGIGSPGEGAMLVQSLQEELGALEKPETPLMESPTTLTR